ncbi:hypothetical protein HAX54_012820, partial [Datura stramonium]|nr:hypothetical protein [Datura stramonium]
MDLGVFETFGIKLEKKERTNQEHGKIKMTHFHARGARTFALQCYGGREAPCLPAKKQARGTLPSIALAGAKQPFSRRDGTGDAGQDCCVGIGNVAR